MTCEPYEEGFYVTDDKDSPNDHIVIGDEVTITAHDNADLVGKTGTVVAIGKGWYGVRVEWDAETGPGDYTGGGTLLHRVEEGNLTEN